LNAKGRLEVGGIARKRMLQARHYIMRNFLYIAFGEPDTWKSEQRLIVPKEVTVVADAIFYDEEGRMHIVEADHKQLMIKNKKKIEKYNRLRELNVLGDSPKFVWITTTEYRRQKLIELCEGLDSMIFTVSEFS
jgi:hypothetical protein